MRKQIPVDGVIRVDVEDTSTYLIYEDYDDAAHMAELLGTAARPADFDGEGRAISYYVRLT